MSIDVKKTCPEVEMKVLLVFSEVIKKAATVEKLTKSDKRISSTASQLPETLQKQFKRLVNSSQQIKALF